jgi:hypothetical protein
MAYESSKSSTKNQVGKPGASAKSSAKLAALQETKSGMPTKSGSEMALQECDAIEAELASLKVAYEHYFMGVERTPPSRAHEDLKKRVERLKSSFVRNTSAKFRVQSIHSKFVTYERLWQRTLLEIENGTYKRDVVKAKRRIEKKKPEADKARSKGSVELPDSDVEDLDAVLSSALKSSGAGPLEPVPFRGVPSVAPLVPPVAPLVPPVAPLVPPVAPLAGKPARGSPLPGIPSVAPVVPPVAPATARPAGAGPRPTGRSPSAASASELSDDKLKSVYDAYVAAKRRNKEDTSKMNYDSVAASLRKQVPELMNKHGAKSVEFKVVIKDGKAVLKAVPK